MTSTKEEKPKKQNHKPSNLRFVKMVAMEDETIEREFK